MGLEIPRSSQITRVGPKSNDKRPYSRQRRDTDRREDGNMTMEAEIGVIWPQVKECPQPSADRRGKEQILNQSPQR